MALAGCASYQTKVLKARQVLAQDPAKAAKGLQKLATTKGKDQLVYLLDYATALQEAGQYKQSIKYFLKANDMSEIKNYVSLSKETASLLLNQGQVQYYGDPYERVLINAMLAIDYLMLNNTDDALVEARRINEKLEYFRTEGKKKYDQNLFGIYLGGVIWEATHSYDDAYIAYRQAFKLDPSIDCLKQDLVRAAWLDQRPSELHRWEKRFHIKPNPVWKNRKYGQLVLIYEQGWGPRKYPRPNVPRFPKLFPVPSRTVRAQLVAKSGTKSFQQESEQIFSVQNVAIKTLDDDYAALVAKRVAGVATKAVIADQVRQKNQALGDLLWIAMNVSDQADLRQWSTLPQSFQMARLFLKKGTYQIQISGLDQKGAPTGEAAKPFTVEVAPGKTTFIHWRSYR